MYTGSIPVLAYNKFQSLSRIFAVIREFQTWIFERVVLSHPYGSSSQRKRMCETLRWLPGHRGPSKDQNTNFFSTISTSLPFIENQLRSGVRTFRTYAVEAFADAASVRNCRTCFVALLIMSPNPSLSLAHTVIIRTEHSLHQAGT